MVARAGGYFRDHLKGQSGVTQGDALFPKIFNVDEDAVLRHWVPLVAVTEEAADHIT